MHHNNRLILHVDDDPQMTRLVAKVLSDRGYDVVSINDPERALDEIVNGEIRVVLLDIAMPNLDGLKLLRQIKSFDGGVQVIMLTGLVSMSTALQSLRWGAEACFFKPLTDFDPLVTALEDTFRKIDRWWEALEEMSHRKHEGQTPAGVLSP